MIDPPFQNPVPTPETYTGIILIEILNIFFQNKGNKLDGVVVERLPYLAFSGSNFCDIRCIRCDYLTTDFPLRFVMDHKSGSALQECEKVTLLY